MARSPERAGDTRRGRGVGGTRSVRVVPGNVSDSGSRGKVDITSPERRAPTDPTRRSYPLSSSPFEAS